MATKFDIETAQSEVHDLKAALQRALDALDCAESCETEGDCVASLKDARDEAKSVVKEIAELLS